MITLLNTQEIILLARRLTIEAKEFRRGYVSLGRTHSWGVDAQFTHGLRKALFAIAAERAREICTRDGCWPSPWVIHVLLATWGPAVPLERLNGPHRIPTELLSLRLRPLGGWTCEPIVMNRLFHAHPLCGVLLQQAGDKVDG